MSKLENPLFSFTARGSLSKQITFSGPPRRSLARPYSAPTGAPTAQQSAWRQHVRTSKFRWTQLRTTPQDRAAWTLAAKLISRQWTGYNAWMSWYLNAAVAGAFPGLLYQWGRFDLGPGLISIAKTRLGGIVADRRLYWGYSPTALVFEQPVNEFSTTWTTVVSGDPGRVVFARFHGYTPTGLERFRSGIHTFTLQP